ncbi:hypothetical protein [Brevundimonas sp.]|uniref:hypothetical protein n=1 Tax=Brevundimonas sp. TaxID=1871086 RepID=UPI002FC7E244
MLQKAKIFGARKQKGREAGEQLYGSGAEMNPRQGSDRRLPNPPSGYDSNIVRAVWSELARSAAGVAQQVVDVPGLADADA